MSTQQGKALPGEQNERLREVVRNLVALEFQGNASKAAKAIGVSQSLLSEFLGGGRGAGTKLVNALAAHTGRSIDDLYGRRVVRVPDDARAYQRLGDHPEFAGALAEALTRPSLADRAALERVGDLAMSEPPEHLTADAVIRIAEGLAMAKPFRRG